MGRGRGRRKRKEEKGRWFKRRKQKGKRRLSRIKEEPENKTPQIVIAIRLGRHLVRHLPLPSQRSGRHSFNNHRYLA